MDVQSTGKLLPVLLKSVKHLECGWKELGARHRKYILKLLVYW